MTDNKIDLAQLGLTEENLAERVVENIVDQLMETGENSEDICERVFRKLDKQNEQRIKVAVSDLGQRLVDPKIGDMIESWTLQKTNEWGEAKGVKKTFTEYLIHCAESYMVEPVNHEGKPKTKDAYNWRQNTTRIVYLIEKHLQFTIETAMEHALKDANNQIANGISAAIKHSLADVQKKLKVTVSK